MHWRFWNMASQFLEYSYGSESVNRSQVDIKRKTCDILSWRKILFSIYPPPTLIHLSHLLTSASKPATSAPPFQPLHQRNVCRVPWLSCEPLYATNTSHCKQETFLHEYPLHWVLLPTKKKRTTKRYSPVLHTSNTVAILITETSFWTCVCTSYT
jgi:hypothetical protein